MGLPTGKGSGLNEVKVPRQKNFGVEVNLETTDRQVSFCELQFDVVVGVDGEWNQQSRSSGSQMTIRELQSVYPRAPDRNKGKKDWETDSIKQYRQIQTHQDLYAVALRESGHLDFYWNGNLVDTQEMAADNTARLLLDGDVEDGVEVNLQFQDVYIDFDNIYLRADVRESKHNEAQ